jgi:hypothetical protein
MKKVYVFFTAVFVVVAICALAQDSQKSFILKREKNSYTGKTDFYYLDPARKEHYPLPKDGNGKDLQLAGIEVNSIDKLYQIELEIFSKEEIKSFATNVSFADCIISSSGKIVSVSFIFHGWEPNVSVTKLQEYASQIKENITYILAYNQEPTQEGYAGQFIRIFRSLNPPRNIKSKAGN